MKTLEHLRRTHAALLEAGGNLDTVATQHEATQEGSEAAELREDVLRALARLEGLYGRLALRTATLAPAVEAPARKPRQARERLVQPAEAPEEDSEATPATSADGLCPTEGCGRPARRNGKPCSRCYQREWARRKAAAA